MYIRKDAIGNCVLFLSKVFSNKSGNIANLRFFVADCPEKSVHGKRMQKICFVCCTPY